MPMPMRMLYTGPMWTIRSHAMTGQSIRSVRSQLKEEVALQEGI